MKKLYLHIGAHKSASTTLQRSVRFNKKQFLDEHGISFVGGADLVESDFLEHFKQLSRGTMSIGSASYCESLRKAKISLESILDKIPNQEVLLSWEGVLGHSALDEYQGIYTHSKAVADSLRYVTENYDTRVLLIVRRQDEFIESCYLQQVKEGRLITFEDFLDKLDISSLSWLDVADNLDKEFKSFTVIPFDLIRNIGTRGFIELCLQVMCSRKLSLDNIRFVDKANASFSKYGVDVALEILPKISESKRGEINKILFEEFNSDKMEKASFFLRFHRRILIRALSSDNLKLVERYFQAAVGKHQGEIEEITKNWTEG